MWYFGALVEDSVGFSQKIFARSTILMPTTQANRGNNNTTLTPTIPHTEAENIKSQFLKVSPCGPRKGLFLAT